MDSRYNWHCPENLILNHCELLSTEFTKPTENVIKFLRTTNALQNSDKMKPPKRANVSYFVKQKCGISLGNINHFASDRPEEICRGRLGASFSSVPSI